MHRTLPGKGLRSAVDKPCLAVFSLFHICRRPKEDRDAVVDIALAERIGREPVNRVNGEFVMVDILVDRVDNDRRIAAPAQFAVWVAQKDLARVIPEISAVAVADGYAAFIKQIVNEIFRRDVHAPVPHHHHCGNALAAGRIFRPLVDVRHIQTDGCRLLRRLAFRRLSLLRRDRLCRADGLGRFGRRRHGRGRGDCRRFRCGCHRRRRRFNPCCRFCFQSSPMPPHGKNRDCCANQNERKCARCDPQRFSVLPAKTFEFCPLQIELPRSIRFVLWRITEDPTRVRLPARLFPSGCPALQWNAEKLSLPAA